MAELGGVNNAIRIPTSLDGNFFKRYIEFLSPLHHLTSREQEVLAALLKVRFEYSDAIKDDALLDEYIMSDTAKAKVRAKVKEECGVSDALFNVILSKLRKIGIIKDGRFKINIIPKKLHKDDKFFTLVLLFDLDANNTK